MRRFTIILFIFSLTIPFSNAIAQKIEWSAKKPLTWDDFRGKKPRRSRFAAVTNSSIHYELKTDSTDSIIVKVTALFNPKKSWKKNKNPSPYLLRHEQTHFDIAEVFARRIRRAFDDYRSNHKYSHNTPFEFRVIYENNWLSCRHLQWRYDFATRHSRRKRQQEE